MNELKAKQLVQEKLPEKRFAHSLRVAETAVLMARLFKADEKKCHLAGLLHDYCKYDDLNDMHEIVKENSLDDELQLYTSAILHGPIAAFLMEKEFNIHDEEILLAIKNHTSGRADMNLVEKIIFVADYIEPARTTPGVEDIRDIVYNDHDLERAVFEITRRNICYLAEQGVKIYSETFKCYNYYN